MKKIILFDFSKVISEIGISHFLAKKLSKILNIHEIKIRKIYKNHFPNILISNIGVKNIVEELFAYKKENISKKNIYKIFKTIPTINKDIIKLINYLKKYYDIRLISDTYKELGKEIRKKYKNLFKKCIFSYEIKDKKSSIDFRKKIYHSNMILLIDDKKENIDNAKSLGIIGIEYRGFKASAKEIIKKLIPEKKYNKQKYNDIIKRNCKLIRWHLRDRKK